ncbi:MAG: bifunctional folylpolyglutamate synthase/dihydrofolate synthase [Proteobacteria bacterium]|nr:bifunctional folylpolyglutamate synthase/dihydrofolate synthase [Pseudomonadota bacterium]
MLSSGAPLSDWLTWLETLSPKEIDLGLERVQVLLERLGLQSPQHLLLVAGTNGKGSSVAMADALLRALGKRVGAYTSPHIHRYNERIVVHGEVASDAQIIAAFEQVEAVRGDVALTYFEYGTLAAAVIFAQAELDVWILEVGLGGRLDASNAFMPTASLITNVSLDHCDWLGNDVETIAAEKAGVMRADLPTVFGDDPAPKSVCQHADAVNARLLLAGREFDVAFRADGSWDWRGPSATLKALRVPGLVGEFQVRNAAAVLALLDAAGLADNMDAQLVNAVLPSLRLTGRLQRRRVDGVEWIFDVAHNPAAAQAFAASLALLEPAGETIAIIGLLADKDVRGMISPLLDAVDRWIAVTAGNDRAVAANELARQIASLSGKPCLVAETFADAVENARRSASENDRILVTGSFYTVGPVLDEPGTDPLPEI